MTASEMFGVPIEGMPGEIRRRAKAINFGIIYGISAFGLANQLGIPREEAGAYIRKYFERFPGIRDYMEATKRSARADGYVTTIFGRKCHYPRINASNPSERAFNERAAINAPIQGSAADIIRRAMIRMDDALARAGLTRAHAVAGARRTRVRGAGRRDRGDPAGGGPGDGRGARAGAETACAPAGRRARGAELGRGALACATAIVAKRSSAIRRSSGGGCGPRAFPRAGPGCAGNAGSRMTSISERYRALVLDHRFEYDPAQAALADRLDALRERLQGYEADAEAERARPVDGRKARRAAARPLCSWACRPRQDDADGPLLRRGRGATQATRAFPCLHGRRARPPASMAPGAQERRSDRRGPDRAGRGRARARGFAPLLRRIRGARHRRRDDPRAALRRALRRGRGRRRDVECRPGRSLQGRAQPHPVPPLRRPAARAAATSSSSTRAPTTGWRSSSALRSTMRRSAPRRTPRSTRPSSPSPAPSEGRRPQIELLGRLLEVPQAIDGVARFDFDSLCRRAARLGRLSRNRRALPHRAHRPHPRA